MQHDLKEYPVQVIDNTTDTSSCIELECGYNCTDIGNAKRLVSLYGDNIRYCAASRSWYIWDGSRWRVDTKNQILEMAKDVVDLIHQEVYYAKRDNEWTKDDVKLLSQWAFASESEHHIEAMVRLAQSDPRISVSPDELDADPWLINCPSGTLDLRDLEHPFELREHRREDLLTKMALVNPDQDANGEVFYSALFKALPDDQVAFLQRAWGSALEPTTMNKAVYIIYGDANAMKTTCSQPPIYALGDYACPFDISSFIKQTGSARPGRPQPEIVSLEGKLAAYCEETPDGMVFNSARLKLLSSSGKIRTRTLWERYEHDIQLIATFFIETNELPRIDIHNDEQAQAVFNRLYVITYLNSIPPDDADSDILKKLSSDKETLSSVFAWILGGYYAYKKDGLQPPDSVKEASAEYQRKMNPLVDFFNDEIVMGPTKIHSLSDDPKTKPIETIHVLVSDLYDRFLEWDQETTRKTAKLVRSKQAFGIHFKKLAEARGLVKTRVKDFQAWAGCHLRDDSDDVDDGEVRQVRQVEGHFYTSPRERIITYRDFIQNSPEVSVLDVIPDKNTDQAELVEDIMQILNGFKKGRTAFIDLATDDFAAAVDAQVKADKPELRGYDVKQFYKNLIEIHKPAQAIVAECAHGSHYEHSATA
jgi:P4 family phage/plasmid primase-like protien